VTPEQARIRHLEQENAGLRRTQADMLTTNLRQREEIANLTTALHGFSVKGRPPSTDDPGGTLPGDG